MMHYGFNPDDDESVKLHPADIQLLQFVKNPTQRGVVQGDLMDGIIYALHLTHAQFKKTIPSLKIFAFSDCTGELNLDGSESVFQNMASLNMSLTIIKLPCSKEMHSTVETLVSSVDGTIYQYEDAHEQLTGLHAKSVKPVTVFRGDLELNDSVLFPNQSLSIKVFMYNKTSMTKPESAKKFNSTSSDPTDRNVTMSRSFYVKAEPGENEEEYADDDETALTQTEVDKESISEGIVYGRRIIDYHEEDKLAWTFETFKSLLIHSFVPLNKIPRHYLVSNVILVIPQPGDENAKVSFISLVQAMVNSNVCAVLRYCSRDGLPPKMGIMWCSPKGHGFFCQIPFKDDVRKYTFAKLDESLYNENAPRKKLKMDSRLEDANHTKKAMLDFVKSMDLNEENG
jgi:hypothetical protein